MPSMIDVQCKCGRRFGWCGSFANRPACPKCGHRPPQEELDETDHKVEADRKLFETHPQRATLDQLREQRVKAGLTLRQAAKILGMFPSDLSDIEWGRSTLSPELAEELAKTYGVQPASEAPK